MIAETDRHYAMGILAAKRAMSDGNQFSAMCNQAEEVLAKPDLQSASRSLRDDLALREDLENYNLASGRMIVSMNRDIWNRWCAAIGDRT